MGIVRIEPFRGLDSLSRRLNTFFTDFEKGVNIEFGGFNPKVDIAEDEKQVHITAELPGMAKEDVKITISEDGALTLKGHKQAKKKNEEKTEDNVFIRVERSYGEFSRSFMLPDNISKESIKAEFRDGLLNISLDKKEPERPKEVEVTIA